MISWAVQARRSFAVAATGVVAALVVGCSLGSVAHDDCAADAECTAAFGLGSVCDEGFCTASPPCSTGHDCRREVGGGACVDGKCVGELPADEYCKLAEPQEAAAAPLGGELPPVVIGGVFSLGQENDPLMSAAARLAVREMNRVGGTNGQRFALVVCTPDEATAQADGEARKPFMEHVVDYLGGTLGAPAIVGPSSSTDAFFAIHRVVEQKLPTVVVSPSATSVQLADEVDRLDPADEVGLFWRTCANDELQGRVLADLVSADSAVERVAVVYLQDAYGEGLAQVFNDAYAGESQAYPYDGAADMPGIAAEVAKFAPQAVIVIGVVAADALAFLREVPGKGYESAKFFFTDGVKNATELLNPELPAAVRAIVANARGTGPAPASGSNYDLLRTNLKNSFDFEPNDVSFIAHAYDATYVAGYGIVWASSAGPRYDGRDVAVGLTNLSSGPSVKIAPTEWATAKGALFQRQSIDIDGTSGPLDFDPATGEAPGPIEVWKVSADGTSLETESIVTP